MAMATKLLITVLLLLVVSATTAEAEERKLKSIVGPFPKTTVSIANNLEGHENLQVHCKETGNDYGIHQVPYGQTYNLEFESDVVTDTYCGFVFNNALHWFDIYLGKRDKFTCGFNCHWTIYEAGPCLHWPHGCFQWNRD